MATTILVRKIPPDTHRLIKMAAAGLGLNINEFCLELLRAGSELMLSGDHQLLAAELLSRIQAPRADLLGPPSRRP